MLIKMWFVHTVFPPFILKSWLAERGIKILLLDKFPMALSPLWKMNEKWTLPCLNKFTQSCLLIIIAAININVLLTSQMNIQWLIFFSFPNVQQQNVNALIFYIAWQLTIRHQTSFLWRLCASSKALLKFLPLENPWVGWHPIIISVPLLMLKEYWM